MSKEPGFIIVLSQPKLVSDEVWNEWYTDYHVPDVLDVPTFVSAARFKTAPELKKDEGDVGTVDTSHTQFLALYYLDDLSFCESPEFYHIPVEHRLLPKPAPEAGNIWSGAYHPLKRYGDWKGNKEPKFLVVGLISPKNLEDLRSWYDKEYMADVEKIPGFIRSSSYKLRGKQYDASPSFSYKEFLAIHEFEQDNGILQSSSTALTQGLNNYASAVGFKYSLCFEHGMDGIKLLSWPYYAIRYLRVQLELS